MGIVYAMAVPHPPLIVKEVGKGQEKQIEDTLNAYDEAAREAGKYNIDTIVLFSPHQIMYSDYFHIAPGKSASGDFSAFNAGQVKMTVDFDAEFILELTKECEENEIPAGPEGQRDKKLDHGTMVPLYFINRYIKNYKLVIVGLSGLSFAKHYELGRLIKKTSEKLNRNVLIVASGDLSHKLKEDGPYGYKKEGPEYDKRVMDVLSRGSFKELLEFPADFCEKAAECGHRSFILMAGALDKTSVTPVKLSYEGPFGVGYGVCTFKVNGADDKRDFLTEFTAVYKQALLKQRRNEDEYVKLARKTVEEYVLSGTRPKVPSGLPDEMYNKQAGVFVSIKKDGRLRGCIGTIQAVRDSIANEIIDNAISASTKDPRFYPIEPDELDSLVISVDVLGDTEKIKSKDELDVKRYGVIVTKGYKRGLLLPNLDGVDTVDEQIEIAKQKAGISALEDCELERFEVVRHY